MASGPLQQITNDWDDFLDIVDIDPVSVHFSHGTALVARKNGSVSMDLFISGGSEETAASVLVKNLLYIHELAMSMLSCIWPDTEGIAKSGFGVKCILIDRDEKKEVLIALA